MRIRTGLGLVLATLLGVAAVATEAKAQTLQRVAEVESVGGYTIYNDKTTIWAELRGTRIARGLIQIERKHRGYQAPLVMTGQLTAQETYTIWSDLYLAQPWRNAQVAARSVNTDFPNTHVTYLGLYKQQIIANFISPAAIPAGMPRISRAMEKFLSDARAAVTKTTEAPLFEYEEAGGRLGFRRAITIARDGKIHDEVSFRANIPGTTQPYAKDGALNPDEVNALLRLCASWSTYPAAFPGNPQAYDGMGITTTLYRFGIARKVFAGEPATRARSYTRILGEVVRLADAIP